MKQVFGPDFSVGPENKTGSNPRFPMPAAPPLINHSPSRRKIHRGLPPLSSVLGTFQGFPDHLNSQEYLTRHLRRAAKKLQGKAARPFYSMREIISHFGTPLRTVAIVYEQLELEGLLHRIQGSQTLITGRRSSPSRPIRAVIGLPLWLHALVISPYSRLFHLELEERLRGHGFIADTIFFREDEIGHHGFTERLLRHNLDFIIWHTPHPLIRQMLLSLKDHGVRQILIQASDNPSSLAFPTYHQNWQGAYLQMAAAWQKAGIKKVLVPEPAYLPSRKAMRSFASTQQSFGMQTLSVENSPQSLLELSLKQSPHTSAVAFLDQSGAEALCTREPRLIETIMQRCRLAFCRGPVRLPYFFNRNGAADWVRFSAMEAASRLAEDLRFNNIPAVGHPFAFHARYEANISFRDAVEPL